jgi:hypothetical protein
MQASRVAVIAVLIVAGCASEGSTLRARKATTADRRCATLPACQAYMQKVRQRVYESWTGSASLPPGTVLIGLKIDATGNATAVRTIGAADEDFARQARSAVAYASPFGPLPASLGFLDNEPITLELSLPAPVGQGAPKAPKAKR